MKISKLIELHFSVSNSIGLELNLGDIYLCQNNKIYRNIRNQALKYGYKFSAEANNAYQALPLSQLTAILSTKVIPYLDNVSVLQQVEKQIPNQVVWDDISDNLKKNFLFHESCHAVARELAPDFKDNNKVLTMLMEESFANTCELLAVIDAQDMAHRIFYEWNSYTALFEARTNLKNAMEEIGQETFGKIIFYGFLHSNHLFDSFDDNQLNRVLKLIGFKITEQKKLKTIKALVKLCFTLDPRFKDVTTRFHMKLNGVEMDSKKLSNFGYFENFEKNSGYSEYVNKLIQGLV